MYNLYQRSRKIFCIVKAHQFLINIGSPNFYVLAFDPIFTLKSFMYSIFIYDSSSFDYIRIFKSV